jgi:hypothetical protein
MSKHDPIPLAATLRGDLWDAGYRPIALPTRGKAPRSPGWLNSARADPPAAVVSAPVSSELNTGVVADGLRAIDLDIEDFGAASRVHAVAEDMLGPAPCRYRANSCRRLLVYNALEGAPRKLALQGELGSVEVLGFGQQFLAYGRHPSGVQLFWRPKPLHAIPRADLSSVTEEQIGLFLAAIAPLLGAADQPACGGSGVAAPTLTAPMPTAKLRGRLQGILDKVVRTTVGSRGNVFFWAACRCAEMAVQGMLDWELAESLLLDAGRRAGLRAAAMRASLWSAYRTVTRHV